MISLAQLVVERGRRSDLDDLLKSPLDAALALAQMRDVAGQVAQDLHFDMPGAGDEFFHIDIAAAERRLAPRTGNADRRARSPPR